MSDLLAVDHHFAFGENWKDFITVVDETRVNAAVAGINRLFPEGLVGKTVLDIGCGSGLSALAMLKVGAARVECVDIDPNSVAATRQLLADVPAGRWSARIESVFDLAGRYDVVHSWGVLHHTGDMWRAVEKAASLVAPGGVLAIAIYRKTPSCGFWQHEKRFYTRNPWSRPIIRALYNLAFTAALLVKGRSPVAYKRDYRSNRGMNFSHDVHDWLGGYPYESASPDEISSVAGKLGFDLVRHQGKPASGAGLLGSGCDEYVFRRTHAAA